MVLGRTGTQVFLLASERDKSMQESSVSLVPLSPAHYGHHADEHGGIDLSHLLETVSGSGRIFSEAKQERNAPEKHPPPQFGA